MAHVSDDHLQRGRRRLTATVTDLEVRRQRALLIALAFGSQTVEDAEAGLDELALLTETAGSDTVDWAIQKRERPDPATYIGKGKTAKLASLGKALDIDVVVVEGTLTPVQQRNLQQAFGCDVVDRTALILDIFAQHAHSREGMAQVELALLRYRSNRCRPAATPGARPAAAPAYRRWPWSATPTRVNRAFSTGSPMPVCSWKTGCSRRSTPPLAGSTCRGAAPHCCRTRWASFTTSPTNWSRPFGPLHVVDASNDRAEQQLIAVRSTLAEIHASGVPEIVVLNKSDVASAAAVARLAGHHTDSVTVSAATGDGIPNLLEALEESLTPATVHLDVLIPYDRGDLVAEAHRLGEVLAETHEEHGTRLEALIPVAEARPFEAFGS
jgi:50S ribosomal subunit-associated GTPase HflX